MMLNEANFLNLFILFFFFKVSCANNKFWNPYTESSPQAFIFLFVYISLTLIEESGKPCCFSSHQYAPHPARQILNLVVEVSRPRASQRLLPTSPPETEALPSLVSVAVDAQPSSRISTRSRVLWPVSVSVSAGRGTTWCHGLKLNL